MLMAFSLNTKLSGDVFPRKLTSSVKLDGLSQNSSLSQASRAGHGRKRIASTDQVDHSVLDDGLGGFQPIAGTGPRNAVPVLDAKQCAMRRTQDMGAFEVEELPGPKIQWRTDMGAGIDVNEGRVIAPNDHEGPSDAGDLGNDAG